MQNLKQYSEQLESSPLRPETNLALDALNRLIHEYKEEQLAKRTTMRGDELTQNQAHFAFLKSQVTAPDYPPTHIAPDKLKDFFANFFRYVGSQSSETICADPFFSRITAWIVHYDLYLLESNLTIPRQLQDVLSAYRSERTSELSAPLSSSARSSAGKKSLYSWHYEGPRTFDKIMANLKNSNADTDVVIFSCKDFATMDLTAEQTLQAIDVLLELSALPTKPLAPYAYEDTASHAKSRIRPYAWKALCKLVVPATRSFPVIQRLFELLDRNKETLDYSVSNGIEGMTFQGLEEIDPDYFGEKLLSLEEPIRQAANTLLAKLESSLLEPTPSAKPQDAKLRTRLAPSSLLAASIDELMATFLHPTHWLEFYCSGLLLYKQQQALSAAQRVQIVEQLLEQSQSSDPLFELRACEMLCRFAIPNTHFEDVLYRVLKAIDVLHGSYWKFKSHALEKLKLLAANLTISPNIKMNIKRFLAKVDIDKPSSEILFILLKKYKWQPQEKSTVLRYAFSLIFTDRATRQYPRIINFIESMSTPGTIAPDHLDLILKWAANDTEFGTTTLSQLAITVLQGMIIPPKDSDKVLSVLFAKAKGCNSAHLTTIIKAIAGLQIPAEWRERIKEYFLQYIDYILKQDPPDRTAYTLLMPALLETYTLKFGLVPEDLVAKLLNDIHPVNALAWGNYLPYLRLPQASVNLALLDKFLVAIARDLGDFFETTEIQGQKIAAVLAPLLQRCSSEEQLSSFILYIRSFTKRHQFSQELCRPLFTLLDTYTDELRARLLPDTRPVATLPATLAPAAAEEAPKPRDQKDRPQQPTPRSSFFQWPFWSSPSTDSLSPSTAPKSDEKSRTRAVAILKEIEEMWGNDYQKEGETEKQYMARHYGISREIRSWRDKLDKGAINLKKLQEFRDSVGNKVTAIPQASPAPK